MESEAASALALRLLELEQRFESYCALHEEELKEIRSTLNQLRVDILNAKRNQSSSAPPHRSSTIRDGEDSEEESMETLPILAL